jgi:hypothetical protein
MTKAGMSGVAPAKAKPALGPGERQGANAKIVDANIVNARVHG